MTLEKFQNPELKGVIRHKLKSTYTSSGLRLLKSHVLSSYSALGLRPNDLRSKTQHLQRCLQYRHCDLIAARRLIDNDLLRATYTLNCVPVGFFADPVTKVCTKPLVCPWCFVRLRLQPIYEALVGYSKETLAAHRLIGWFRPFEWGEPLPFFDRRLGPHRWYRATMTAQYVVPNVFQGRLHGYHFGVQLIPDSYSGSTQIVEHLKTKAVSFNHVWFYGSASALTLFHLLENFAKASSIWSDLACKENLNIFQTLYDNEAYANAQLCRIHTFKLR